MSVGVCLFVFVYLFVLIGCNKLVGSFKNSVGSSVRMQKRSTHLNLVASRSLILYNSKYKVGVTELYWYCCVLDFCDTLFVQEVCQVHLATKMPTGIEKQMLA